VLLVLWDVDYTLVDSAGHGRVAFDDAFEEVFGRRPEGEVPFPGRTDHQIALSILERNGVEDAGTYLPRVLEALAGTLAAKEERIRADGRAMPGAREALEGLAARDGVVQSLLTGNLEANAAVKLAAFGLEGLVDLEVGAYGSDPHRERSDLVEVARRKVAAKHGEPETITLIGDTPLDVRAAREAGARSVAVATGPYDAAELAKAGPDAVLEDLRDTAAVAAAVGA
jgi:phosphoglycolate phosphatase-like HAD superfamily hydrolase